MTEIIIRNTLSQDIPGVVALQRACFPEPFPSEFLFNSSHVESHLSLFPQGQFVAVANSLVVASATNLLVRQSSWDHHLPLEEITGGLDIKNHISGGEILYGLDISVHPSFRGLGLARSLYNHRFDLVRNQSLHSYGTVCRVPDFLASGISTVSDYVDQVLKANVIDRTMTPLIRIGLQFESVIENYLDDPESGNAGIALRWTP